MYSGKVNLKAGLDEASTTYWNILTVHRGREHLHVRQPDEHTGRYYPQKHFEVSEVHAVVSKVKVH